MSQVSIALLKWTNRDNATELLTPPLNGGTVTVKCLTPGDAVDGEYVATELNRYT